MRRQQRGFAERVNPHRLYRSNHKLLSGVTAGIAEYYGLNVTGSRILVAILSLVFFPLVPMLYVIMIFVLPRRPEQLYQTPDDEDFWRTTTHHPKQSFSELRYRFRDMEDRVRSMEAYVTSAKYEFERELGRPPSQTPSDLRK